MGQDNKFLMVQLVVQALITVVLIAFAWGMYTIIGGPGADSIGSMVIGGVMTHWFKESSSIARKAAAPDMSIQNAENVDITEAPDDKKTARKKTAVRHSER